MEWEDKLEELLRQKNQNIELKEKRKEQIPIEIRNFLENIVTPAFSAIKDVFEKNNRKVEFDIDLPLKLANFVIYFTTEEIKKHDRELRPLEFFYFIHIELSQSTILAHPGCAYYNKDWNRDWIPHHSFFGEPEKHIEFISSITKELIISNFMYLFESYIYLGE